jgi:hypothetical protein
MISVRLDIFTDEAITEIMKILGVKRRSEVIRLAIWFLVILTDPRLTVKNLLKQEALEKIMKGEDVTLNEAMKPLNQLIKELGYPESS